MPEDNSPPALPLAWNGLVVGLIPDGNRRWAKMHKRPLQDTYAIAAQRTAESVIFFRDRGVKHLYLYAASPGNVQHRDPAIWNTLVGAFVSTFRSTISALPRTGISFSLFGETSGVPAPDFTWLKELQDPSGTLNCGIVFNYSVEWELARG